MELALPGALAHSIVTWNRLLAGNWLDAQVGSHVLIGATGVIYVALHTVLMFVLLRFDQVTTIAAIFFINSYNTILLGADWTTWFAPAGLATLMLLLGVATFAFWRSLGSRELLGIGKRSLRDGAATKGSG